MNEEQKIIIVDDMNIFVRCALSFIRYVILFGGFWFNYAFLGASTILNLFICILILMSAFTKSRAKTMSSEGALAYLAMRLGKVIS